MMPNDGFPLGKKSWIGVALVVLLVSSALVASGPPGPTDDGKTTSAAELRFAEVSEERGLDYRRNQSGKFATTGRSGVFVSDVDNDGWPDVLAIGGDSPALFRNVGGEFRRGRSFVNENVTVKSALFFDYDNDGWDDLLLLPIGDYPRFYENEQGEFTRRDVGLRTLDLTVPTAASAADYNADGCLDLVIVQNGDWRDRLPRREQMVADVREDVTGSHVIVDEDNGGKNLLLRGDCRSFENVTEAAGIRGRRWTTTTSFVDLTGDGLPDVHAANDFNFDYLYENQGDGTFAMRKIDETNRHAMSSEVADFNNDGHFDIFVTNIYFENSILLDRALNSLDNSGNNLLINHGNGTFSSRESEYAVVDGGWGWAAAAVDLNNDGDRDLVHTMQYYLNESISDLVKTYPRAWEFGTDSFIQQNSSAIGFERTNGLGLAHLDYDRDGDQDLVIANRAGQFRLFENRGASGNWLQVSVQGDADTPAVGATVSVVTDQGTRYIAGNAKVDFLSQDTRTLHVGLESDGPVTVRVVWPDGRQRTFDDVSVNQRVTVRPNGDSRASNATVS